MSFLDLDERLIDLAGSGGRLLLAHRRRQGVSRKVDITLVEGAVANEDHLREIRSIRQRTKILIAFGDCAVTGNVTALRNLFSAGGRSESRLSGNAPIVVGHTGGERHRAHDCWTASCASTTWCRWIISCRAALLRRIPSTHS